MDEDFDLLVVGGGINGAAIARDAAGRGRRVLLVEQGDLGSATSSASTKLIHGGLRYLEYGALRLVREALKERAVMLRTAPHLVRPMRFVLPAEMAGRSAWMLRAGLLLYDALAVGGDLPRSHRIRLTPPPLRAGARRGFTYWDAWVDDSRLVILNAIDARTRGADIRPRHRLIDAVRSPEKWNATIEDRRSGQRFSVAARAVANMAGPWVEDVLHRLGVSSRSNVRLVKGSHIIVPRIAGHHDAMLLQQPDGRVTFLIPYDDRFTLIGTTEIEVSDPGAATIADDEIAYLIDAGNRWLLHPIDRGMIVATYSGIRALHDDGAAEAKAVTRDYRLDLDTNGAPLLTAFGGKITTARVLAEQAVNRLCGGRPWTSRAPLPGGDLGRPFERALADIEALYPWLGAQRAPRMLHAYGTMLHDLLRGIRSAGELGEDFGVGLTAREVDHLVRKEWAMTSEDILRRRTHLGLHLSAEQVHRLDRYLETGHA